MGTLGMLSKADLLERRLRKGVRLDAEAGLGGVECAEDGTEPKAAPFAAPRDLKHLVPAVSLEQRARRKVGLD